MGCLCLLVPAQFVQRDRQRHEGFRVYGIQGEAAFELPNGFLELSPIMVDEPEGVVNVGKVRAACHRLAQYRFRAPEVLFRESSFPDGYERGQVCVHRYLSPGPENFSLALFLTSAASSFFPSRSSASARRDIKEDKAFVSE